MLPRFSKFIALAITNRSILIFFSELNLMCTDDPDYIKRHNDTPVTLQLSLTVR